MAEIPDGWIKATGLKRSNARPNLGGLLRRHKVGPNWEDKTFPGADLSSLLRRHKVGPNWEDKTFPGADHTQIFSRVLDGERVLITQPYGWGMETILEAVKVCEELGLEMTIGGGSWHNPACFVVEVEKAGLPFRS